MAGIIMIGDTVRVTNPDRSSFHQSEPGTVIGFPTTGYARIIWDILDGDGTIEEDIHIQRLEVVES